MAQDYPRLEILLNDDVSTDRTYERMAKAAAAYRGPHRVISARNAENRGTLANVYAAAARASGELIILNGGDDVSYPHRVSATVEHWRRTGADALHGRFDVIDIEGRVVERGWTADTNRFWMRDHFPGQTIEPIYGASSAYAREVFDRYPLPDERIMSEDAFFTLMLSLDRRPITFIPEPLVMYRRHSESLTNEAPARDETAIVARERKQARFAASQRDLLELFARARLVRGLAPARTPALDDDIRLFDLRARWMEMSLSKRLRAFAPARRRDQLDWLLPRLGGLGLFVAAKRAVKTWRGQQA